MNVIFQKKNQNFETVKNYFLLLLKWRCLIFVVTITGFIFDSSTLYFKIDPKVTHPVYSGK